MTIEEKIKELILAKYGSVRAFAIAKELTYTNVDSILRRGIKNATWTNVKKLCEALEISVDELAEEKIVPLNTNLQSRSHMTDIEAIIAYTKRNIQEYTDLTIGGEPMTQNEIEILLDAIDIGIGIIQRNRGRNITL